MHPFVRNAPQRRVPLQTRTLSRIPVGLTVKQLTLRQEQEYGWQEVAHRS